MYPAKRNQGACSACGIKPQQIHKDATMHLETTHEDSYTDATSQSFSRFIDIHKDAFKQAVTAI